MPRPAVAFSSNACQVSESSLIRVEYDECVEVCGVGRWHPILPSESREILRQRDANIKDFQVTTRGVAHQINLESMLRTECHSGKSWAIRFADIEHVEVPAGGGIERFRRAFLRMVHADKWYEPYSSAPYLTQDLLFQHWPGNVEDEQLLHTTVEEVFQGMTMTNLRYVNMAEWLHYWMLLQDDPASTAVASTNGRLQLLLQYDPKVLERLQLLFEAAAEPSPATGQLSMSHQTLLQVCQSLVLQPDPLLEQEFAKEAVERHVNGNCVFEEDDQLLYHDFLSIMLGRQRHRVYLWMYDISYGKAKSWSWLLGRHFTAFWHTAVVVEFAESPMEFWYGGKLFVSDAGTTPFGDPVEKRFMGYSYKSKEEVVDYISRCLGPDFHKGNYDSFTHNCNHFSDKLLMHLTNEHVPSEILNQPELIMNSTAILQLLRPFLNRWLGNVQLGDELQANSAEERESECLLGPLALVSFVRRDGGLEIQGRVESLEDDYCVIKSLDFWRSCPVLRRLKKSQITCVLERGLQRARSIRRGLPARGNVNGKACCWFPSLLTSLEPTMVAKPSALSFRSVEDGPVEVANF